MRSAGVITSYSIHYTKLYDEGIRAYWNEENLFVFRLKEHVKRFRRSGQFYDISLNFTDRQVSDAIRGICKKNNMKSSCYIRPFYFVGDYGINLHVTEKAPTHFAIRITSYNVCYTKLLRCGLNM